MNCTNVQNVVGLMDRNITLNLGTQSSAQAAAHCWGTEPDATLGAPFDVIVMSDVVYDPCLYQPLVDSMVALSHPKTLVLMAHRERNPDNAIFFAKCREHFKVIEVAHGQVGKGRYGGAPEPTPSAGAGETKPTRTCSDVFVYEMFLLEKA